LNWNLTREIARTLPEESTAPRNSKNAKKEVPLLRLFEFLEANTFPNTGER